MRETKNINITALAGGVGGAKLADGLAYLLAPGELVVIVNTGDDFVHYGLYICPDLDTVTYTLAGIANEKTGWGRKNETWNAFESIENLGGSTWFQLGDRDLGLHLERSQRLYEGESLSQITAEFCREFGIHNRILPMCDKPVPTLVETDKGVIPFQEYFVHQQCEPVVKGFQFQNAEHTDPAPGVIESLSKSDIVVICPSNPWVSIGPMLSINGLLDALKSTIVLSISPIIGGKAVKGPAAKMYRELGVEPSAYSVARHYKNFLTGFVIDNKDIDQKHEISNLGIKIMITDIMMNTQQDRIRLAEEVISFGQAIISG